MERTVITRGYKILTGSGYILERPLQLVCDLEIGAEYEGDAEEDTDVPRDDENVQQRPGSRRVREASHTAMNRLVGVAANENEEG